jgi:RecB family exonuclease
MSIPIDFQFSQSNLTDFTTCARRFELKYLWQLRWPAIEAEPIQEGEQLRQLGLDFHRLVQQHLAGLEATILSQTLADEAQELRTWWQNYLDRRPAWLNEADLYPELTLSAPLANFRLMARFDLLAFRPDGTVWIIDWKTARDKPARSNLARHMQSRVYPYLLAAAGAAYHGGRPIPPEAIRMMYWYPAVPDQAEIFEYSLAQQRQDEAYLADLIGQIQGCAASDEFPLVAGNKPCRTCVYRSFCDRGEKAGPLLRQETPEVEELDVLALEWDQIAEIQF